MTTGASGPARAPTPLPKAAPTASISSESVTAAGQRPAQSPAASVHSAGPVSHQSTTRRGGRTGASDPLSDRSTAFLIRRTLCPQHLEKGGTTPAPIEELLTPLTSRNDVDLQLYALLAIILREYVQNWYNKITPDETFVAEIIQIIAHCTRALEQRLRKVDLESLLFDELPDLLDKHITASRAARDAITQPPIQTDPHEIYHSLCPLPALSPVPKANNPSTVAEQAANEAAYRQLLVHGVLAVLLPTEDLENESLTAIVGQILSELIIGNIVANKLSEPWFIWEGLSIMSGVIQRRRAERSPRQPHSAVEGVGGRWGFSAQHLLLSFLHWCFFVAAFVKILVTTVVTSRSLPSRTARGSGRHDNLTERKPTGETTDAASLLDSLYATVKTPVVAFRCWAAISNLVEMDVRMPWLCGAISMAQWIAMAGPGRIANADGIIDRLLSHFIHRNVLDPAQLPPLLRTIRGSLFPNNMPGKSSIVAPTSAEELRALRRRCASSLWALVPKGVGGLYFGGDRSGAFWAPWTAALVAPGTPDRAGGKQDELRRSPDLDQVRSGPKNGQSQALDADQTKIAKSKSSNSSNGYNGGENGGQHQGPTVAGQPASVKTAADGPGNGLEDGQRIKDANEARIIAEIECGILDVFGDAYCNKHLMYSVLELVLVRLMPELAEKGVVDLWEERLS